MIYYMADPHFFHDNIIKLSKRPFKSVEDMNDSIISNINKKVKKNDTLIILGDVCFLKKGNVSDIVGCLNRIHAKKQLIIGNHDKKALNHKEFRDCFEKVSMYDVIHDCGKRVILFHYPIEEWDGFFRGSIHLHGHIHNNEENMKKVKNRYNLSVDVTNFTPMSLNEIINQEE